MKRLTVIVAGVFLLAGVVYGQTEYDLSTFYLRGVENNIFHSPSSYINNLGETLTEDSLIQSDGLNGFGWDLELKRDFGRHRLRLEQDGWLRRYGSYSTANQGDYQAELKYDYDLNRKIDLGARLQGSKTNKIGTNVLGEELTKTFSYAETRADGYFELRPTRQNRTKLDFSWRNKNYASDPGVESLSHRLTDLGIGSKQDFQLGTTTHNIELELNWEDKAYRDRTATDSTGSSRDITYPRRHWQYLSAQLTYGLELFRHWTVEPSFEITRRNDLFQDYYTYNQVENGIDLGYESNRLAVDAGFKSTNRHYLVRTARQLQGPEPDLVYKYHRYTLEASYAIVSGVFLTGEYEHLARITNVTVETMRTRRSYNYSRFNFGVAFGLQGVFHLGDIRGGRNKSGNRRHGEEERD